MIQELTLPILERNHLKYYVTSNTAPVLLKPDGTTVPLLTVDIKDVLFETVLDAHEAASKYYDSHNEPYPYIAEWGEALLAMMHGAVHLTKTKVSDDLKPEVMDF